MGVWGVLKSMLKVLITVCYIRYGTTFYVKVTIVRGPSRRGEKSFAAGAIFCRKAIDSGLIYGKITRAGDRLLPPGGEKCRATPQHKHRSVGAWRMNQLFTAFSKGMDTIWGVLSGITVGDVLDILFLTVLLYKACQLVRETHTGQLIKGVIYLLIFYFAAGWLHMTMMRILLQALLEIGFLAIIVLFQPELRHWLERLGKSRIGSLGSRLSKEEEEVALRRTIDGIVRASVSMADAKIGALMVIEQSTILNDVVSSGTVVDAAVSRDLLCNIFYPKSPLHDGAVVLRGNRICAAGCILPLTQNQDLSRELGTRHRAAIGMSENADAIVVVVSEETGVISLARKGELRRSFDAITLKTELEALLIGDRFEKKNDGKMKKVLKRRSK